jgi:DNA-directed RNA polymerase subunit RPC12/RpoP
MRQKEGIVDLKACGRCGGDLIREELLGETELVCLQCGHRTFAQTNAFPRYRVVQRRPRVAKRAA